MWLQRSSLAAEGLHRLRDLVAPRDCAGCGGAAAPGRPLCPRCRERLDAAVPVAAEPAFTGGAATAAAGQYADVLRHCLLAYKERRRRDLAGTLAAMLARTLAVLEFDRRPLWLIPVPATRRALRERGFDHVGLLVRRLAWSLPDARVARVLRCAPRPDSAGLGLGERRRVAMAALRPRPGPLRALADDLAHHRSAPFGPTAADLRDGPARVIVVDDIVTSGATLAAAATVLRNGGVRVCGALAVAATSRRIRRKTGSPGGDIPGWKRYCLEISGRLRARRDRVKGEGILPVIPPRSRGRIPTGGTREVRFIETPG